MNNQNNNFNINNNDCDNNQGRRPRFQPIYFVIAGPTGSTGGTVGPTGPTHTLLSESKWYFLI